ncbi:IclR family transcriptional regulator domain-containing protein [Streptomyces inhibens]|uniref:IclR family transcriptional regulator domain-containing protein n=1 Tax=Streptomyces inhibens TaxID=2293571 RepID=UPI000FFB50A2|nr:IclR family transcriptional regulator C-terminal domain-containing protein [Streptomyces inhibens]
MSRYDDHRGGAGCPEPVVPAGLAELLAQLTGPPDFWDRPDGHFGPLAEMYALTAEERAHANSLYRLGSKALGRDELLPAANWLGAAAEAGHPGALFRMAALTTRAGDEGRESVRFLVAEAARHGHGDARALLEATAGDRLTDRPACPVIEDPQFIDEVRNGLGLPRVPQLPAGTNRGRAFASAEHTPLGGQEAAAPPRLVRVPAPRLGQVRGPGWVQREMSRPETGSPADDRPQLSAHSGAARPVDGLLLPLPPEQPGFMPSAPADENEGHEPWSANALRPAVLTDMARRTPAHTDTPQQWKAAVRALDILYLVDAAGGITTRALARRSGLPLAAVAWLLHWLRGQHLISTVAGAHFPGPLMEMTRDPEQRDRLLQQTLAGLRDQLGAAVYVSGYAHGDVEVLQSAYGPEAPAVEEWVNFRDAAHASAVGKSLLAQLDFDGRMNHLARYRPIKLTDRTITNPRALFETLDGHGPHAAQFDLLEYSPLEVCAAFPLGIPGQATCVALSLPAGQRHRLLPAARALSERSAGLLMALLLTDEAADDRRPLPPAAAAEGADQVTIAATAHALPRIHASQR